MTDYSQTVDPSGRVVVDITLGRFAGTYTLHFTAAGVVTIGNGKNILAGG